jgi:DNA-binding winged helix-turn-helix (wHTH) protein
LIACAFAVINTVNKFVKFVNLSVMNLLSSCKHILTKANYLFGAFLLLMLALTCAAFTLIGDDGLDLSRQEIMLRKIGHEILLQSGDSASRVLPVKKVAENEYQLRFENEFTFQPDSLVKIVGRSLAKNSLAHNYVVNVLNCTGKDVIFGYAIYQNEKDNIVPCSGRKQPKSCYVVELKFESKGITKAQKGYLLGGIPLLVFIGFMVTRTGRRKTNLNENKSDIADSFKIGEAIFDPGKRLLTNANGVVELTAKENKLLLIFAREPNVTIERGRLQKEIWEDEGVIVGRSLDMFVSKLRKKLEHDLSVKLINIHGKGYKLEIKEPILLNKFSR